MSTNTSLRQTIPIVVPSVLVGIIAPRMVLGVLFAAVVPKMENVDDLMPVALLLVLTCAPILSAITAVALGVLRRERMGLGGAPASGFYWRPITLAAGLSALAAACCSTGWYFSPIPF